MLSIYPKQYRSLLSVRDTQVAIKAIKDWFEVSLAQELNLTRVSAPLFVRPETGLNDNLNGVERPVTFTVKGLGERQCEVVQSLAKWKRFALKKYSFHPGEGLYTDMNAVRRDEELDNLHSIYVDQWDWEAIIDRKDRNLWTLMGYVRKIYKALKQTERRLIQAFPVLETYLLDRISFITSQELEDAYPELTPRERENVHARKKGAICIMQIGGPLRSGMRHDGRAPDYDDWQLNADILVHYPVLDCAVEISSMGIRVDERSLDVQLKLAGADDRRSLPYHQDVLAGRLPQTIGGGIGQSRLCMILLGKAHIGEVQCSVWPQDMVEECKKSNILLL
ncbi:MAG: aspartate--ammonia ligase [Bacillota bacterium]|jgi:aspartate--ammonia ligase|nr:aspartate--ammonia ligase [Bacillota bacterium]